MIIWQVPDGDFIEIDFDNCLLICTMIEEEEEVTSPI